MLEVRAQPGGGCATEETKVEATLRIPVFTLGDRMAKAREEAGLTQEQMADKLRVSHSTVAKWEKDKGQPRDFMDRIKQWSETTQVPIGWLLGIEGEQISRYAYLGADLPEQLELLADAA